MGLRIPENTRIIQIETNGTMSEKQPTDMRPLTRRERFRLNVLVHETWSALQWVGMRDRLRCPKCKAVGTWKPHGSWQARIQGDINVRRWMCKWCGHYNGSLGATDNCYPDQQSHVWSLPGTGSGEGETPAKAVARALGKTWPWRG